MMNITKSLVFPTDIFDQFIIRNLGKAFQHNDRIRSMVNKNYPDFIGGIKLIISYCYLIVKKGGNIHISQDSSTFLLYDQKSKREMTLSDFFRSCYLVLFVIGLRKLPQILKRERLVNSVRGEMLKKLNHTDYLYVWFLAQKKEVNNLKGLIEAKRHIFELSKTTNLPVFMETTVGRLVPLYERMGFHFYWKSQDPASNGTIWFAHNLKG